MHFQKFAFGVIRIDGVTYEHDVVIDRGEVRKRKKKPSKKFRAEFGHTPISVIDAAATRPVSGACPSNVGRAGVKEGVNELGCATPLLT